MKHVATSQSIGILHPSSFIFHLSSFIFHLSSLFLYQGLYMAKHFGASCSSRQSSPLTHCHFQDTCTSSLPHWQQRSEATRQARGVIAAHRRASETCRSSVVEPLSLEPLKDGLWHTLHMFHVASFILHLSCCILHVPHLNRPCRTLQGTHV